MTTEERIAELEKRLTDAEGQIKALSAKSVGVPVLLNQWQFPKGIIKQEMLAATSTVGKGDLYYGDGSNNFVRLAIGTTGQKLTVSGGVPVWS